jgi:phosphoserine phosphatase
MNLIVQGPSITPQQALELAGLAGSTRIYEVAGHAWRIHNAAPADAIPAYCEQNRIDFAFVPEGRRFADLKLLAMDMDSTLITIECIELDYPESLRKRVGVLAGLEASVLERVYAERLRLTAGAERLVAKCKAHAVKLLLVSGGFTFFTDRLRERLGIDYTISNRLEIQDGRLSGRVLGEIVDADAKAAKFCEVAEALGADKVQTVAIGDGANDLKMMAHAGTSVAFHAKPVVRAQASCAITWSGLDGVINLFE